jgi:hypothetical protein
MTKFNLKFTEEVHGKSESFLILHKQTNEELHSFRTRKQLDDYLNEHGVGGIRVVLEKSTEYVVEILP